MLCGCDETILDIVAVKKIFSRCCVEEESCPVSGGMKIVLSRQKGFAEALAPTTAITHLARHPRFFDTRQSHNSRRSIRSIHMTVSSAVFLQSSKRILISSPQTVEMSQVDVKASSWKLVEVGRVVLFNSGPFSGRLATIVEIIDHKRVRLRSPDNSHVKISRSG